MTYGMVNCLLDDDESISAGHVLRAGALLLADHAVTVEANRGNGMSRVA
jgi:hypothetical protein